MSLLSNNNPSNGCSVILNEYGEIVDIKIPNVSSINSSFPFIIIVQSAPTAQGLCDTYVQNLGIIYYVYGCYIKWV